MRKSILILAAAATVLASCTNEKVLNEIQTSSTPTVIGFGTYAEKPTKAIKTYSTGVQLEDYHKSFVVYGTKYSSIKDFDIEADTIYVFGDVASATDSVAGTICDYVEGKTFYGSNWEYTDVRYWDKQATYDFIAFAPKFAPMAYKYAKADSKVGAKGNMFVSSDFKLCGQNLQDTIEAASGSHLSEILVGFTKSYEDEPGKDLDIMISELNSNQNGNDYINKTKNDNKDVNLQFHHILAKLNITIAKANVLDTATVTIKSLSLDSLKYKGRYNGEKWVAYNRVPGDTTYSIKFNAEDNSAKYSVIPASTDTNKKKYFVESIVMPQTLDSTCTLTVKYDIQRGSHKEPFISRFSIYDENIFSEFKDCYNYTLNITINPTYITFDAKSDKWDHEGSANEQLN